MACCPSASRLPGCPLGPAFRLALVLIGLLSLAGCGRKPPVVSINGAPITEEAFNQRCAGFVPDANRQQGQTVAIQVLEDLLRQKVLEQEVERLKVMPSEEDVDRRFAAVRRQMEFTGAPLDRRLRMSGRSEEDFKRELRENMIGENFFIHDTPITDAEARAFYEKNKNSSQWTQKERIRISEISVTSPERLKKVLADLRSNTSFSTVAAAYSEDGSQATGGQVPRWFTRDDLTSGTGLPVPVPVISKAFEMKPGEHSDPPIQVSIGTPSSPKAAWVIVKLEEKKPTETLPFEDIKDLARHFARVQKAAPKSTEKQRTYAKLLKDAEIEVNRPEWEEFVKQFKAEVESQADQMNQAPGGGPPGGGGP